jgi:hypothetical protein
VSALPEVVMATVRGVPDVVLVRTGDKRELWASLQVGVGVDSMKWHSAEHITDRRPLVLIDPEDAEQVKVLTAALDKTVITLAASSGWPQVQAALRSLAQPTPPEPQGLGAVVRDAEGNRWVRINKEDADSGRSWVSQQTGRGWSFWSQLDQPVTVLAEGWSE